MEFEWKLDEYGTMWCRFKGPKGEDVALFIQARPAYCDRGHWDFNVETGIPHLDGADSFPRYYMSLETAMEEATKWAVWRLWKATQHGAPSTVYLKTLDGTIVRAKIPVYGVRADGSEIYSREEAEEVFRTESGKTD